MARPTQWPHLLKIKVTQSQADALRALAVREGVPVSEVARRAIAAEVARLNNTVK